MDLQADPGSVADFDGGAEQAVIGSALIDATVAPSLLSAPVSLRPEDFFLPANRMLWATMMRLHQQGTAVDTVTVAGAMPPDMLDECGGVAYLAACAAIVPTSMHASHYAGIVKKNGISRRLSDIGLMLQSGGSVKRRLQQGYTLLEEALRRDSEHLGPTARLRTANSMLDVEAEDILWLYKPYVPLGKLTLVEGDPGVRKSWFTLAIAASVSRGYPLPGDEREGAEPAKTLILADEDGYGDTIRPRLEGLGADLSLIRPVFGLTQANTDLPLTLDATGVEALEVEVEAYRPLLIIIDPLIAYTPSKTDTNAAIDVRLLLRPIMEMAERYRFALVGLRHFKKGPDTATYKGAGSIDYYAAARSVLAVSMDREDSSRSIMAPSKSSIAQRGPAIAFKIGPLAGAFQFLWEGEVAGSVEDMLAPSDTPEETSQIAEATGFLKDQLADGPKPTKEVKKAASDALVAERTLTRAKHKLGVVSRKERGAGAPWLWDLPAALRKKIQAERELEDAGQGDSPRLPYADNDGPGEI